MKQELGKPAKDFDEIIECMREAVKKKVRDAYKKGFDEGSLEVEQRVEGAYQRGVEDGRNETWEAAKKLSWAEKYGGYGDRLDEVFDRTDTFDFLEYSPNEAIAKLKAYEEKQKAEDDIKVGDVVRLCRHIVPYIVTSCDGDDDTYILMTVNGGFIKAEKCNVRKTGRHFDIKKILEEMKE